MKLAALVVLLEDDPRGGEYRFTTRSEHRPAVGSEKVPKAPPMTPVGEIVPQQTVQLAARPTQFNSQRKNL